MVDSLLPQGIMSALQNSDACDHRVISTVLKARRRENEWSTEAERELENAHGRACQMGSEQIISRDSQWTHAEKKGVFMDLMHMVSDSKILSNRSVMLAATAILMVTEGLQKEGRKEGWLPEIQRGLEQLIHNPDLIQVARRKHTPMNTKRSWEKASPCSGRWRRAKQRSETFEFRENRTALYHLAKHCFVGQNEFRLAVYNKGIKIDNTSQRLTLESLLDLKRAVADLAVEEEEIERNVDYYDERSSKRGSAGEPINPEHHRAESPQQKGFHYDSVDQQEPPHSYRKGYWQKSLGGKEVENYSRSNSGQFHERRSNRSYSFCSSEAPPRSDKRQRRFHEYEAVHQRQSGGEHKQEHYYRKEVGGESATNVVSEENGVATLPPVAQKEATDKRNTFVRVLDVDCHDLRDKVLSACDRIGSYKYVGWCQSRHLLDVIFENNREAAAALIDIEALGLWSTKKNPPMKCKVFLKNSDFEGGPYTGGPEASSANAPDYGCREEREYPPKRMPTQRSQQYNGSRSRSPENLGMNRGGKNSRQYAHSGGSSGGGGHRFSPDRPRSRRSQSPPEYQRGYGGGSSKQGVPQNSRPHYNVGRDNYGKYDRREDHRPDSRSYEPSNSPPRVAQSYNDDNRSYTHDHQPGPGYSAASGFTARERYKDSYHRGSSPHKHSGSSLYSSSNRGRAGGQPWHGGGSRWGERTGRSPNSEWKRTGGGPSWRGGRDRGGDMYVRRRGGGRGRGYGGRGGSGMGFYNVEKTTAAAAEYNPELDEGWRQQTEEQQQQQSPEDLGWGLQFVDSSSTAREEDDEHNPNIEGTADGGVAPGHEYVALEEERVE